VDDIFRGFRRQGGQVVYVAIPLNFIKLKPVPKTHTMVRAGSSSGGSSSGGSTWNK
jgi:hypothetical protein